jgi:hypothetical protein
MHVSLSYSKSKTNNKTTKKKTLKEAEEWEILATYRGTRIRITLGFILEAMQARRGE